jgi:uncharacterized protein YyaL (SSP411 family)
MAARHYGLETWVCPEGKAALYVAEPMEGPRGVEEVYHRLAKARSLRKPPFTDTTVYVG